MKTLEDYTISTLILKYKNVIGDRLPEFIISCGCSKENIETLNEFMDEINNPEIKTKDKNKIIDILYDTVSKTYERHQYNDDMEAKSEILLSIYTWFSKDLNRKELEEIKYLLIGEREIGIYVLNEKKDGKPFEIITKGSPKKLKSVRSDQKREIMEMAINTSIKNDDIYSILNMKYQNLGDFFKEQMGNASDEEKEEFIKNNINLIDTESLICNTASRLMYWMVKHQKENDDNTLKSKELIIKTIKEVYNELKKDEYSHECDFALVDNEDNDKIVMYCDLESLKEFLRRCTNNRYYSDEEIEEIHKKILRGEFTTNKEERRIANINKKDLIDACKSYEINEGKRNKDKILKCAVEVGKYLKENKQITEEEIFNLYLNDMINLKVTEQIEDFNEEQCNKKFKMLYDKFIYSDDKKFKKIIENKINRFSELYKTLENKEKVDPDSLIKILTNSYGEDNIIDILNDLNKFGLIDIERCLEYVGINILIKQYREGIFTPAVIRELYDEEKIDLTDIANFINSISKNDKKYISIGALFPGEDEEDKLDRDLLTSECLIVTDDLQNEYKSNKRKKVQNDDTTKFQSEEYITDPFARLSLFQELDKNYILEMTDDGYAVVKCPIAKKVILEKLFDKNGAPYYGAATYILDMDYYRANKAYIHCDGKIVRKELTDFRKVKGVTPIAHVDRKWGRDIKNEFEVEIESQYSEEEIQKIDATIARVERSRTKRMV